MTRTLVVWCPDWPVAAAQPPLQAPAAVLKANRVVCDNAPARRFGIRRGMRRRDAQARCPELLLFEERPERDVRAFADVLATLERLRPGIAPLRPGLVALRSPGRFYGGEAEAGAVFAEALVAQGVWDVRVGVADDLYTAEQAARRAAIQETVVIPEGEARRFLEALPVDVLEDADAVSLLKRLGLPSLGDLAGLPGSDVHTRFGPQAALVHRVLHGRDTRALATRTPPPELDCHVDFEPPLADAEAVCFSSRRTMERFVRQLAERQLVPTEVTIEVYADTQLASSRRWLHPRWFTSVDLVDRLHWQLVGSLRAGDVRSAVDRVRVVPEEVATDHGDGLWGGTDDRVERGIARVQGMLGHEAVLVPALQGGRSPADRQALVPWGERPVGLRPVDRPWPGAIPPPAPARVLAPPTEAAVLDAAGRPVAMLERGCLSSDPFRFRVEGCWERVVAWAGPWPVEELWWEASGRRVARCQVVGSDGRAWLLVFDSGAWFTEAAYD